MNGTFLVINISAEDLKMMKFGQENGARIVTRLFHERIQWNDSPEVVTAAIKKCIPQEDNGPLKTLLVLSSHDIHYKEFTFPFDSRKKVLEAIRFEIAADYPPADYILDHIETTPREPGKKSFLAAIASRENLRRLIRGVEDAGLRIIGITADVCTLGEFFREEQEALVMEMGRQRTLFALYSYGRPFLLREVPIGMHLLSPDAPGANHLELRPLVGEIKRTIHSFSSKTGLSLERLYLSGEITLRPEILDALKHNLDIEIIDRQPETGGGLRVENAGDRMNLYASVLGATEWKRKSASFNFLKEEFLSTDPASLFKYNLRWAAILIVLFIATFLFSSLLELHTLEKRKSFLAAETREVFKAAFPETKRIVDEVKQARSYLEAKRNEAGATGIPSGVYVLDVLGAISSAIPADIEFKVNSLFWEQGKVELNGETDTFKSVNTIQEVLEKSTKFLQVMISNAKSKTEGQHVEFKITLRIAG